MRILSTDHPEVQYQVHLIVGFADGSRNDVQVGFETEQQAINYIGFGCAMGEHFSTGCSLEYLEIKKVKQL